MASTEQERGARFDSTIHYRKPGGATCLGSFEGYEIIQTFVPEGRFSRRAVVYICARADGEIIFTHMSSIKHELVDNHAEESIKRILTVDAIVRVKHRIRRGTYKVGEVYTSNLTEADVKTADRRTA